MSNRRLALLAVAIGVEDLAARLAADEDATVRGAVAAARAEAPPPPPAQASAPEAVDQALYNFGMAMGPLAMSDLAGLDVGWRIRQEHKHLEKLGERHPRIADALCELGRYGHAAARSHAPTAATTSSPSQAIHRNA